MAFPDRQCQIAVHMIRGESTALIFSAPKLIDPGLVAGLMGHGNESPLGEFQPGDSVAVSRVCPAPQKLTHMLS